MSSEVDEKTATVADVTEDVVNPWEVKASDNTGIDYEKLIRKCDHLSSDALFDLSDILFLLRRSFWFDENLFGIDSTH